MSSAVYCKAVVGCHIIQYVGRMRSLFRYYKHVVKVTEFKSGGLAALAAKWRKRAVHANPILCSYGGRGRVLIIHYINIKKNIRIKFVWDGRGFTAHPKGRNPQPHHCENLKTHIKKSVLTRRRSYCMMRLHFAWNKKRGASDSTTAVGRRCEIKSYFDGNPDDLRFARAGHTCYGLQSAWDTVPSDYTNLMARELNGVNKLLHVQQYFPIEPVKFL